jgi:O-antigen/teichoic acid export membrane protein
MDDDDNAARRRLDPAGIGQTSGRDHSVAVGKNFGSLLDGEVSVAGAAAPTRRRATIAALSVPAAAMTANLVSYVLVLAAAHVMSPAEYGALSSQFGLLLVATVPMLAIQTVTARRVAAGTGPAGVVHGAQQIAGGAALLGAVLSPALAAFLHLGGPLDVLLVSAAVVPMAVVGAAMGVAQGRRRFPRLAALTLASTAGRSAGGLVGLAVAPSSASVLLGMLAGSLLVAVWVVATTVRQSPGGLRRLLGAAGDRRRHGVVNEALHAAHAHGVFLLLTSLDVLLARHVLTAEEAGSYAVGSVLTRSTLWLPQSVVLLLFASLAQAQHYRRTARQATAALVAIGVLSVAGTAVLAPVLVSIIGGSRYHGLDSIAWLFALLGAELSLIQFGVLAALAQRRVRRAALVWATIAADLITVLSQQSQMTTERLVTTLVVVTAVAALAATALTLRQVVAPEGHGVGVKLGSTPEPKDGATPMATG